LLCPLCAQAIADNPEAEKSKLPSGGICYAPYLLGGPLEMMIWAAKFRGRADLSYALAELLINAPKTSAMVQKCDLLAPIPLSPIRQFKRGYNQSAEIAHALAKYHSTPVHRGWQRRHRRPQHQLGRVERLTNLEGAFKRPKNVENKRVLLIDDVITTGSTVREATKALLQAGAQSVDAIAVASSNWSYLKT
jgi:ComF family protein